MSASPYTYQRYLLGSLRTTLQLDELQATALQPGIKSAYRITCHYPDQTAPNSVATLVRGVTGPPSLHIAYEGDAAPQVTDLDPEAYKAFTSALSRAKFDRMDDPPGIPATGAVLWLVERAAAGFYKAVLLSPAVVTPPHDALVTALETHLPLAVQPLETS
jgi:hypothetical protein